MSMYDPDFVSSFYDAYGNREWERFDKTLADKVSLQIHLDHLRRFIRQGDHVLDAGAGPGRFTIEMAKLGARITVGDISPGQLESNRNRVTEAGYENAVVARELLDIVDLSRYADGTFNATVCFGGPLSYVFDQADRALGELLRVTKSDGHLLLSVMSLMGTTRALLQPILDLTKQGGLDEVNRISNTGDLNGPLARNHRAHMYRWSELESMINRRRGQVVAASASNFLSAGNEAVSEYMEADPDLWQAFLRWERYYCAQPGALDGGTHILAIVRKSSVP